MHFPRSVWASLGRSAWHVAGIRPLAARVRRTLVCAALLASALAAPRDTCAAPPAPVPLCKSTWWMSSAGSTSWTKLRDDPDGVPLSQLRFSTGYSAPIEFEEGFLDFDDDEKSDVFTAEPIGNGQYYRWRYSPHGSGAWVDLAFDTTPLDQLRFGVFGDDFFHTDVFSVGPGGQFRYSQSGTGSWVNLAYDPGASVDQLYFGDFDWDYRTDVLKIVQVDPLTVQWQVSYKGTESYQVLNTVSSLYPGLQFGDIDDNGKTDAFFSLPDPNVSGQWDWYWFPNSTGAPQLLSTRTDENQNALLVGDFNGDHTADLFYTTPHAGGGLQWWYHYRLLEPPMTQGDKQLAYDTTPADQLRFADFNGDGIVDLFRMDACDLFSDTFEYRPSPYTLVQWSKVQQGVHNAVYVNSPAAMGGTVFGLDAFVGFGDTSSAYVEDDTPNAETHYHARFQINPHDFDPGESSGAFRVRVAIAFQGNPQKRIVAIVLKRQNGNYFIEARARQDDDTLDDTGFVPITDDIHMIDFDWTRATSPSAGDGELDFWVDGVLQSTISSVADGNATIDFIRLGLMSIKPGASGDVYFDNFASGH